MNIGERRAHLIEQISAISDEQVLEMLEESLLFFKQSDATDITDGLNEYQLQELKALVEEPSEKDTISLEELRANTARWRTKL